MKRIRKTAITLALVAALGVGSSITVCAKTTTMVSANKDKISDIDKGTIIQTDTFQGSIARYIWEYFFG